MRNLLTLSKEKLLRSPKVFTWLFLVLSFVGFADATFLTAKHYSGTPLSCSIFEGCDKVLTSQYATIGSVPIAIFGAFYYLVIFLLTVIFIETKQIQIINLTANLTVVGFLVSIILVWLQLFVIGAICFYCLISAFTSISLFILGLLVLISKKNWQLAKDV